MDVKTAIILAFLLISIITNIAVYVKLLKKYEETSEEAKFRAYFMLLGTKVDEVKEKLEDLSVAVSDIKIEGGQRTDELSTYVRNKMPVKDIAKKMNKSVKEVDITGSDYKAGDNNCKEWASAVLNAEHRATIIGNIKKGNNEIKIFARQSGIVLERILITQVGDKKKESYLGAVNGIKVKDIVKCDS